MQTANEHINSLERQLQLADIGIPERNPWIPRERDEIIQKAKECLGIREEWIPCIEAKSALALSRGRTHVHALTSTSWDRCFCSAHLYLPQHAPLEGLPLTILCCGHAKGGKQAESYRRMAWMLSELGCAVLVPDNIGQGERSAMGHADVVAPFRCGCSLQGLIVMETMGWLRWAQSDGRFDKKRIAAIGNSGGGTLTLFLGALCRDDLAVLSSSGYPSTFAFVAAKEKKHCHCNILPGVVGNLEMWQLYGCFAPKPLFLFQGRMDNLFPEDLFHLVCRKTELAYFMCGSSSAFRSAVFFGDHPWDDERRASLAAFLADSMGIDKSREPTVFPEEQPLNCYAAWPKEALITNELATQLTGVSACVDDELYKVYMPELESRPDTQLARVGFRQLAAQLQAFLSPEMRTSDKPDACDSYGRA